jgi:hypothetical protein
MMYRSTRARSVFTASEAISSRHYAGSKFLSPQPDVGVGSSPVQAPKHKSSQHHLFTVPDPLRISSLDHFL